MSSFEQNLALAREAIEYTASRLTIGRGNNLSDNLDLFHPGLPAICVYQMRSHRVNTVTISQIATQAESYRCGNCGEQAAVAMMFLHRRGVRPLDYMTLTNGDHAFVIIDRTNGSNERQYSTWGANAVICDAWSRLAYRATEVANYMSSMCSGSVPVSRSVYQDT